MKSFFASHEEALLRLPEDPRFRIPVWLARKGDSEGCPSTLATPEAFRLVLGLDLPVPADACRSEADPVFIAALIREVRGGDRVFVEDPDPLAAAALAAARVHPDAEFVVRVPDGRAPARAAAAARLNDVEVTFLRREDSDPPGCNVHAARTRTGFRIVASEPGLNAAPRHASGGADAARDSFALPGSGTTVEILRRRAAPSAGTLPLPAAGYLLDDERARALARRLVEGPLDTRGLSRAVIFLTNRCNMSCGYCLSIRHPMRPWRDQDVLDHVTELAAGGTRHIQWTGGEASLHPRILDFVRHATALGLTSSTSTNASGPPARFLDLARAGMRRFYISLDALDPAEFDAITGTRGRLGNVLAVIEALCSARDAGAAIHVTLNTVLTRHRVEALLAAGGAELRRLLRWLRGSGADDFKFLPASTEPAETLFPEGARALFRSICEEEVPPRHAMFHHRLASLSGSGHGFADWRRRHCFQALDDRAADSRGVYGCVIQIREGGKPIYGHGDTSVIKARCLREFLHGNRTDDPICRRSCFDLYRDLNERVAHFIACGVAPQEAAAISV